MNNRQGRGMIGKRGEDVACHYLESIGHTILERNWRYSHLEIDIISLSPMGVHFIEVKSVTAPSTINPECKVNLSKQERITSAALAFMSSVDHGEIGSSEMFFDVIGVTFDGYSTHVDFFPSAWIPLYFGR